MDKRQICWAHLVRRFTAFAESTRPEVQRLGQSLLLLSQAQLAEWHQLGEGVAARVRFQKFIARLEPVFLGHLQRGVELQVGDVSGACANLLAHKDALFTYAFAPGVPPTNNHAERELRGFVMWRKQTAGTRSQRGNLFAERIMTVVHTLRKQRRHVLSYLEQAAVSALRREAIPALMSNGP